MITRDLHVEDISAANPLALAGLYLSNAERSVGDVRRTWTYAANAILFEESVPADFYTSARRLREICTPGLRAEIFLG